MKIISLHLKNINSLVGEWSIDFSESSYAEYGFFAITGPTGAGKSTILDGICLALYGKTPRLKKISDSANDLMSTNTGECLAEVVFVTEKGRFRSRWYQKRAYNRPDGKLQPPMRELSHADTNKLIETKIKEIEPLIEEYTGMDFERFTRTMLLAQGGFTAFLLAPVQDRSAILEEITGTEIYSDLSKMVFERSREEETRLKTLEEEYLAMKYLSPEETSLLQDEIARLTGDLRKTEQEIRTVQDQVRWLETLHTILGELSRLEIGYKETQNEYDSFSGQRITLETANRARQAEGIYLLLCTNRESLQNQKTRIDEEKQKLTTILEECNTARDEEGQAQTALENARNALEEDEKTAREVRIIDSRISLKRPEYERCASRIAGCKSGIRNITETIREYEQEVQRATRDKQRAEEYIRTHETDASLPEAYSGIERRYAEYAEIKDEQKKNLEKLEEYTGKEREYAKKIDEIEKECQKIGNTCTETDTRISRRESEIQERLSGLTPEELNNSVHALTIRLRDLSDLSRQVRELTRQHEEYVDLESKIVQTGAAMAEAGTELAALQERESVMNSLVSSLEKQLILAERVLSAEGIRKGLMDGEPCPVCGATHHPYADGNIPQTGPIEAELKNRRIDLAEIRSSASRISENLTGFSTRNEGYNLERTKLAGEIETGTRTVQRLGSESGIDLSQGNETEVVNQAIQDCSEDLQMKTGIKNQVEPLLRENEQDRITREKDQKSLAEWKERQGVAERDHIGITRDSIHCQETCVSLDARLDTLRRDLSAVISRYGYTEDSLPDQAVRELSDRKTAYTEQKSTLESKSQLTARMELEIKKARENLAEKEKELALLQEEESIIKEELTLLQEKRREMYGEKNPDEEEKRLKHIVSLLDKQRELTSKKRDEKSQAVTRLQEAVVQHEKEWKNSLEKGEDISKEFEKILSDNGFPSEEEFLSALLPPDTLRELEEHEEKRKNDLISSAARVQEKRGELSREREKDLTSESAETLNTEIILKRQAVQEMSGLIFQKQQEVSDNREREAAAKKLAEDITRQKRELTRWTKLNHLIGSKEGTKFRSYAQGLTLSVLLYHANMHLQKLTDRYFLTTKKQTPLEIHVVDTYRAGEVRVAQNLSGGESFIVSLALALGLSAMSSKNVRVDSLFLDEGFGTLDEEALDTALSTLAGMRQEGKLIGVISHVQALKDRIPVQILVEKESGGKSRLSGPGCRFHPGRG